MGVQLTKELVRVDQVVGEDKTQAVVEGTITLPSGKPDIQQVISHVHATLDTESLTTDIIENKVIVEGKIDVNAMYVGSVPEGTQPVHFVEGTVDFSFFVKIPGAKKDMDVRVKARIEHVQSSFDPNRPREIKVRIIVEFFVKVTRRVKIEIVVDATGPEDLQVLKKSLRVDDVVGEARAQNIVKSDVSVPEAKPDILDIIRVEGKARETETKIIDDKIIIEGVLEVSVLYVAAVPEGTPQQPVHFMEAEVPFTQFVEIPGAREDMTKLVKVEVEHIRGRRKDNRTVTVEAILKIKAKVFETKVLDVVVDVFSPSEKLEVEKTLLKVDQVIGEDENEIVVKDVLNVPTEKPPIEQIYRTRAKAEVTESSIIDDKVIVEGVLTLDTLYVADVTGIPGAPLQPLHFMEHEIPFTTFVEIPGAREDMTLDFDVDVEHVSSKVDPNDNRKFEVRVVIRLRAKVTKMVQLEVVVNVIEPEEEEKEEEKEEKEKKEEEKPSMTIYIVQRGDTLWNIAKRYNVTVDSIVKANNIANPDSIMPGQQLVIPRRMM
ncbi:MAG TPA: DUF3794 domain-containing protein [Thermoanaerobacterales bacterium]|nr:DUF3794 domain-containing protein [Thermoanaerobacterales bacterium]